MVITERIIILLTLLHSIHHQIVNTVPEHTTCSSDDDCERHSECVQNLCRCRDELLGDGTTCKPAPRHKCKSDKNCHAFALCLTGHCICQHTFSGNGRYCRSGWNVCFEFDPCGWNAVCAADPILPSHAWCQCKVGTDKKGNCIECTKDEHCKSYGRCESNKCVCRDELIKTRNRCVPNRTPHKCKDNKDCHVKAKCDDGICICQGNTVGNGKFCRDAKPCAPGWISCGHGVCLIDPLLPKRTDCKCDRGFFEDFPFGCIECRRNQDCPSYSTCVNSVCKCRAELVKKGNKCYPAPLHKCRYSKDCHSKAKCFYGKCVCQGDTTGNGRYCRDSLPCSTAQSASCGSQSTCLLDPIFPEDPICRCKKGFKMSKESKCVDEDECKSRKARCGNRCRNTIGSFHCVPCPRGYTEGKNGACLAPSQFQCDCGEHEECFNDECVCQEGYEIDEYGDCVWPDEELLSVDKANSVRASAACTLIALGLFGYQIIAV